MKSFPEARRRSQAEEFVYGQNLRDVDAQANDYAERVKRNLMKVCAAYLRNTPTRNYGKKKKERGNAPSLKNIRDSTIVNLRR